MANTKVEAPPAPVEWDLPEPRTDHSSPDKSFVDDERAAHIKAREAAQNKAVQDRFVSEPPRRIVEAQQKIEEAAPFRATAQDDQETHRAKAKGAARRPEAGAAQGRKVGGQRAQALASSSGGEALVEDTGKLEAQLQSLVERLCDLESQGDASAARVNLPPEDHQKRVLAMALQRQRLELQFRMALMQLLTAGITFPLMADPRLTFKRLLRRFRRWPRQLRPGHRPRTLADFDAFLAWVFRPPLMPPQVAEALEDP